ncbi:MAG: YbbR-like domain-containing protein [Desulfuromonadales bacterium]|nr:YbbR-like domain-containing protein [Desulfuromonadales bacterium]
MTPLTADSVKKTYLRNLSLKLLSLALALCVWSLATVSHKTTARISIPVRVCNIPHGYAIKRPTTASVEVTMEGPGNLIATTRRSKGAVTLDLDGAVKPGTTLFAHLESYLALPEGVTVLRITPASLEITLEAERSPQGELHP